MNLIVTCARNLESDAKNEIKKILTGLEDNQNEVVITDMSGILTITTSVKPERVIEHVKKMIDDEPWSIRYCLRIIPIHETVDTNIQSIVSSATKLTHIIGKKDSYRILVEKRNSNLSTKEIISQIADKIKNKVSLDEPDWIVLIEIIGNTTGVAVIKKDSILSVNKTKRGF